MTNKPRALFYDIETTPLKAYVWRVGKQVISHKHLCKERNIYNIICITYCWNDGKPAKALTWNYKTQDSSKMIEEFDKLVKQADITIGQNSDRFDVKQINTQRLLHGGKPFPEWADLTDDLLKQTRKFFYLPSYSLDYLSSLFGLGGKIQMVMQDWIDIIEKNGKDGEKAFKKMIRYGKKDIIDTRAVYNKVIKHCKPKFNMSTFLQDFVCVHCGSKKVHKNGVKISGKTRYQTYYCQSHGGYAGKAPIRKNGTVGTLGN